MKLPNIKKTLENCICQLINNTSNKQASEQENKRTNEQASESNTTKTAQDPRALFIYLFADWSFRQGNLKAGAPASDVV